MSASDDPDHASSTYSSSSCSCDVEGRQRRVLMVRRLHPSVNMQELLTRFGSCGIITGCKVFTHKSGRSAGCASVEFAAHQQACAALRTMNGMLLSGKAIHVEWFDASAAVSPYHNSGSNGTDFKPGSLGSSGGNSRMLQHLLTASPTLHLAGSPGANSNSHLLHRQKSEPLRGAVPCSPGARRRLNHCTSLGTRGATKHGQDPTAAAAAALANAMNPAAQSLAALQLLAAAMQPAGANPLGTPPRHNGLELGHQHSCPAASLQHLLAQHNWSAAAAAAATGAAGAGLPPLSTSHTAAGALGSRGLGPPNSSSSHQQLLQRRNSMGSSHDAAFAAAAAALHSPLAVAHQQQQAAAAAQSWQAQHMLLEQQHHQLLMQAQAQAVAAAAAAAAAGGGLARSSTSPAELLSEALASLQLLGDPPPSPHGGPPLSPMAAASLLQQHSPPAHCFMPAASAGMGGGPRDAAAMSAAAVAAELLASTAPTAPPAADHHLTSPFAALAPLLDPADIPDVLPGTSTMGALPPASPAATAAAAAAAHVLLRSQSQQLHQQQAPVPPLLAPSLSHLDGHMAEAPEVWRIGERGSLPGTNPTSFAGMDPKLRQPEGGAGSQTDATAAAAGSAAADDSWGGPAPHLRGLNVRRRLQPLASDDLSVEVDTLRGDRVASSPPVSPQVLSPHDPVSPPPRTVGGWLQGMGSAPEGRRNSLPSPLYASTYEDGAAGRPSELLESQPGGGGAAGGVPAAWKGLGRERQGPGGMQAPGPEVSLTALASSPRGGPGSPLAAASPGKGHRGGLSAIDQGFGSFCGDVLFEDGVAAADTAGQHPAAGQDSSSSSNMVGGACGSPMSDGAMEGRGYFGLGEGGRQLAHSAAAAGELQQHLDAEQQLLLQAAQLRAPQLLARHGSLGRHDLGHGLSGGFCTAVGHRWAEEPSMALQVDSFHPYHRHHQQQQQQRMMSLQELTPEELQMELSSAADSCFAAAAAAGRGPGSALSLTRHMSMQLGGVLPQAGPGTFDWESNTLEFPGFFSPPPKGSSTEALDMPVFFEGQRHPGDTAGAAPSQGAASMRGWAGGSGGRTMGAGGAGGGLWGLRPSEAQAAVRRGSAGSGEVVATVTAMHEGHAGVREAAAKWSAGEAAGSSFHGASAAAAAVGRSA